MIIGLTGKSCSGKNRVAELLDPEIFSIIDEDKLGHIALGANKDKIKETFGSDVFGQDGEV
ncbi:MAG: dephospho-CoA kinase, partial [Spirochaetales bacterium]|nr:dephospho-CoA kinase [Spirochaetales bacterium]